MKKRTRHEIADAAVRRWCRFYELTPYFWRSPAWDTDSQIVRCSQGERRRSRSDTKFGEPEDRADCFAMIVGTLMVKGFHRWELEELLIVGSGTVSLYFQHYKAMPADTKRALIALDGEQAREFYLSIIEDARADQLERLMHTRHKANPENRHA